MVTTKVEKKGFKGFFKEYGQYITIIGAILVTYVDMKTSITQGKDHDIQCSKFQDSQQEFNKSVINKYVPLKDTVTSLKNTITDIKDFQVYQDNVNKVYAKAFMNNGINVYPDIYK